MAPAKNNTPDRVIHLAEYWPYQLTVLADWISRRTARIVRTEGGLNLSQWRVLAAIAEKPGRTSAEVVTVTPMDKGIVSRATKALLNMGLVMREASQADGRVSYLHLTEAGRVQYDVLVPRVEAVLSRADEALSPTEQAALSEQLCRLMTVIPTQD